MTGRKPLSGILSVFEEQYPTRMQKESRLDWYQRATGEPDLRFYGKVGPNKSLPLPRKKPKK
jgi:hypothetical protein